MPNNEIPITDGQRKILETVKDELFPQLVNLRNLLVRIQECRIYYQLHSFKLHELDKEYSRVSRDFFVVVQKLETPDILFEGVAGGKENIVHYFQFAGAFKQKIAEGVGYVEIIDRTLDRKIGTIRTTRIFLISIIAIVISIYFA